MPKDAPARPASFRDKSKPRSRTPAHEKVNVRLYELYGADGSYCYRHLLGQVNMNPMGHRVSVGSVVEPASA